jgi:hypothetical protein
MMTKQVLVESSLYMMNQVKLTSFMMIASEEIRVSFFLYTEGKSLITLLFVINHG